VPLIAISFMLLRLITSIFDNMDHSLVVISAIYLEVKELTSKFNHHHHGNNELDNTIFYSPSCNDEQQLLLKVDFSST
jgi:hypothetical protein